jgi:hypothetical protein
MKKVLLGIMFMVLMVSSASAKVLIHNSDLKTDKWTAVKADNYYKAVVKTTTMKNGYNIGTAEIIEMCEFNGRFVTFTHKPLSIETTALVKGDIILVTPNNNAK